MVNKETIVYCAAGVWAFVAASDLAQGEKYNQFADAAYERAEIYGQQHTNDITAQAIGYKNQSEEFYSRAAAGVIVSICLVGFAIHRRSVSKD